MISNGRALESFVAFVEETLVPQGFAVEINQRKFDDDGKQVAEFDVQVQGKLGSTWLNWLIECRDRPASGPAPSSWIEQLVGRRQRFHFNKVTAVSTTGFADVAVEFAKQSGIELRQLRETSPKEFASWLALDHMTLLNRVHELKHARIDIHPSATREQIEAAAHLLKSVDGNARFLRSTATGIISTVSEAFIGVTNLNPKLWDGIVPNGESKAVKLLCNYRNDLDHFVIETPAGPARIGTIGFIGELRMTQTDIPVKAVKYENLESKDAISETAKFEGISGVGPLTVEIHRIAGADQMYVAVKLN